VTDAILVLNIGSSSIKFAVYPADAEAEPLAKGGIDAIGRAPVLTARTASGAVTDEPAPGGRAAGHAELTQWLLGQLTRFLGAARPVAVGHRVVHGGPDFAAPVVIDPGVLERLAALTPLAPGHQPHNLAGVRAVAAIWPDLPQVACFDTAFHRAQPRIAQLFALPRRLTDQGVLRYGFHGLSYEHIASVLPRDAGARAEGRVIVAHLGHGASMCAMRERRSVATTMGFTALDGLVMGKRCGELDPGVVLHLLRDEGMSVGEVDALLSHESGLLGVSGISDDMRDLLASDDPHAAEAVELFVYRAVRWIGSLTAALGGLDALVFTGGIGEHAPEIRARIVEGAAWLGARLDGDANRAGETRIDRPDSAVGLFVIPTDEERVIARATRALTGGADVHAA